jgi:hypothetical protein
MTRQERIETGPSTQEAYENILDELAEIRRAKVLAYGEDRYEDPDVESRMALAYADIYRKFIRIKNMVTRGIYDAPDGETLREAFMDLANYAIMGVQLLGDEKPAKSEHTLEDIEKFGRLKVPNMFAYPAVDQIAVYSSDPNRVIRILNHIFGTPDESWVKDTVEATGFVDDEPASNKANLCFNYSLVKYGLEFEVLSYIEGQNWLTRHENKTGFSHLGMHVTEDEMAIFKKRAESVGIDVVQSVETDSHTNPAIKDTRRYKYVIFGTRHLLGFDLKLIVRVKP